MIPPSRPESLSPLPSPEPSWELLAAYLVGEPLGAAQAEVEAWVARNGDVASQLRDRLDQVSLSQQAQAIAGAMYEAQALRTLAGEFRARADAGSAQAVRRHITLAAPAGVTNRARHILTAMAAVLVIVAGIAVVRTTPSPQSADAGRTYSAPNGQRISVTLPDGTHATLAPATTLHVVDRHVTLDGEALFNVPKQEGTPFTVSAGDVTARVLGTSFSVRAYASDAAVRVAVAEGKVAVENAGERAILTNGDLVTATARNALQMDHNAERVANLLRFTQGVLVLEVQPLAAAAPQLSRWFDLDIRVMPAVAGRRLWLTLQNESVTESLDMIASLTGTRYVRAGRMVTFVQR